MARQTKIRDARSSQEYREAVVRRWHQIWSPRRRVALGDLDNPRSLSYVDRRRNYDRQDGDRSRGRRLIGGGGNDDDDDDEEDD